MEQENKLRIQGNYVVLVREVDVRDVMDYLIQYGILTDEEKEWIEMHGITRHEGVRRLLKIIQKKHNAFEKFCLALEEAYEWLAKDLRDTDPKTVTPPDDVDGVEAEKVAELKSQLWMTAQVVEKFKSDMDAMHLKVVAQENENRMIRQKFEELEQTLKKNGLKGQQQVKEYLEDYVSKKEHPNRAAVECLDGSSVDTKPALKRYSMGDPSNQIEAVARHLAVDVVRYKVNGARKSKPPSNKYAQTMRERVDEVLSKEGAIFEGMLSKIPYEKINGFETLTELANVLFGEETNWGRIVALYAYGGFIAMKIDSRDDSFPVLIGDFLGYYVSTHLMPWIEEKGGWEDFVRHFSEKKNSIAAVDQRVFVFVITLATAVAMYKMLLR